MSHARCGAFQTFEAADSNSPPGNPIAWLTSDTSIKASGRAMACRETADGKERSAKKAVINTNGLYTLVMNLQV